jgi:hypothetical protein
VPGAVIHPVGFFAFSRLLVGAVLLAGCGDYESGAHAGSAASLVVTVTEDQHTLLCSTRQKPVAFGIGSAWLESPDGQTLALARNGGVDLISLGDASSMHLFGDVPSLEGARWSEDSEVLAYFDRGVPMLARRDGSGGFSVPLELLGSSDSVGNQAAEWSRDGRKVAFATHGVGVVMDANGEGAHVFSKTMINGYGTPWMLAFSGDGLMLAGLEAENGTAGKRNVVLVDTQSYDVREVEGIVHYALSGWMGDDSAVTLWDVNVQLWLLPRDGSAARVLPGWGSRPSPTNPQIALGGPGLHLIDLADGSERALLPEDWNVQAVRWSPDGETLGFLTTSEEHGGYISVADGKRLADELGVMGPDGWVALPDARRRTSGIVTQKLRGPAGAGARFALRPPDGTDNLVVEWFTSWLPDGKLAFLSTDGVHIAAADGSSNRVVCPRSMALISAQGPHF